MHFTLLPPAPRSGSFARAAPQRRPASRMEGLSAVEPDDAELVGRCRAGEGGAWALLVRRYQRLVYTVVLRAGLAEDHAAEVFQACFVRLHEQLPRLRDPDRLRAWLVTTAKREALLQRERLARQAEPDELLAAMPDPDPLPEALLERLQLQHALEQALARLDARARHWVRLMFLADPPLSYAELSRQLGVPIGSLGPTRARLLARLRDLLTTR